MGDQNRGPRPCQPLCGGDSIGDKLGVHAGERFIQQQRGSILAEKRPQQGGAALLPAGEPCSGQGQLGIGKAQAAQLPLCLLR